MQNAFVGSLNGQLRDECLNENAFRSLAHANIAASQLLRLQRPIVCPSYVAPCALSLAHFSGGHGGAFALRGTIRTSDHTAAADGAVDISKRKSPRPIRTSSDGVAVGVPNKSTGPYLSSSRQIST
jgi:integrase-like protein